MAVGGALAVAGPAQPAQAEFAGLLPASWASTDVRAPLDIQLNPPGDLPVGAWRDEEGKRHISRAYLTYDMSEVLGRHIYTAEVFLLETAATECTNRELEVWATEEVDEDTSWLSPPDRLSRLELIDSPATPCPGFVTVRATEALQAAAAAGDSTLTVELQVPRRHMANLDLGRRFLTNQVFLSAEYETLPLPRPLASSPDYPPEPAGPVFGANIPGEFTFDADGNTDAVGFQYSWDGGFGGGDPFASEHFVWADSPGGTATIQLAPPTWGSLTLFVRSIRADGVSGGVQRYEFQVRDTAPFVTWDQEQVAAAVPFPITLTPMVEGALEFTYLIEVFGGPEVVSGTAPAGTDGTGTALVTLSEPGPYLVFARSVYPDWTSTESKFILTVP